MSSLPTQLAETLQTAHINQHPDARLDIAPATAADSKEAVSVEDLENDSEDSDDEDVPVSVLRPVPRKRTMPPLPDLRFEQSYLHSLAGADTWWKVLFITTRDQVFMPLTQGLMWNLLLGGWQHWNKTAQLHGNTFGVRARRWWYGVNNWTIPSRKV